MVLSLATRVHLGPNSVLDGNDRQYNAGRP